MDVGNLVQRTIIFNLVLVTGTGLAIATFVQSVPALGASARITLAIILAYAVSLRGAEVRPLSSGAPDGNPSLRADEPGRLFSRGYPLRVLSPHKILARRECCSDPAGRLLPRATARYGGNPAGGSHAGRGRRVLDGLGCIRGRLRQYQSVLDHGTGSGCRLFSRDESRPRALVDRCGKIVVPARGTLV